MRCPNCYSKPRTKAVKTFNTVGGEHVLGKVQKHGGDGGTEAGTHTQKLKCKLRMHNLSTRRTRTN